MKDLPHGPGWEVDQQSQAQLEATVFPHAVFQGLFGSVRDRYYIRKHRERWERRFKKAYPKGQLGYWDNVVIHEHEISEKGRRKMQASELTEEDMKKFEDFFDKEIKPFNPKALMQCFSEDKFQKKDCLFKEKCLKLKRG